MSGQHESIGETPTPSTSKPITSSSTALAYSPNKGKKYYGDNFHHAFECDNPDLTNGRNVLFKCKLAGLTGVANLRKCNGTVSPSPCNIRQNLKIHLYDYHNVSSDLSSGLEGVELPFSINDPLVSALFCTLI